MAVKLVVAVGGVTRDFVAEAQALKARDKTVKGSLQFVAKMLRDQALRDERKATQEANGLSDGDYLFM